ncbi:MAG: glycosyltransferase family 2 protein [Candidatus Aenigmarchaeota archaeon]|nr:glycosyltransferase family 2 protein [Candidatus Aenigmarchaeota archaeon]
MDKIGVLLPAYNEEKNIQTVIKETKKYVPNSTIVVVDDGSTDKTSDLAKKSKVVVLRHNTNKGKGEAIKTGFKYFLKKDISYVIIADADRQYKIKDANKIIKLLKDGRADFVTGYRNWKEVPLRHKLGNFVWRNSFNLLFGTNLRDSNCGFMGLTKDGMRKIKNIHGGYIVENELFVEALRNKLKIEQVPVSVEYREKSGIARGIRVVLGVLIFIVKEGFKYRLGLW